MKIHTDTITAADLESVTPKGCHIQHMQKGSRSKARAYNLAMVADPGKDRHGITRRYSTNGAYGSTDGTYRAATWVEWGDMIAELFKIDPDARIGNYYGAREFLEMTEHDAEQRDRFGGFFEATPHAERWADELAEIVWGVRA
jgi:hypothetical protein